MFFNIGRNNEIILLRREFLFIYICIVSIYKLVSSNIN